MRTAPHSTLYACPVKPCIFFCFTGAPCSLLFTFHVSLFTSMRYATSKGHPGEISCAVTSSISLGKEGGGRRAEIQLGAADCFTRSVPVQYQELRKLTSL